MNLAERAKQLKSDIPAVFLALKRRDTPFAAKLLALITVAYALSPIDLVPDFIPVLGCLDDVILLPALVALTVRCIPRDIWVESQANAAGLWQGGKPQKWYCAVPIVLMWLLVAFLVAKAISPRF